MMRRAFFRSVITSALSLRCTATDAYARRHIGPSATDTTHMLNLLGFDNLDSFVTAVVPRDIVRPNPIPHAAAMSETEALKHLRTIMSKNKQLKSFIGHGYYECITPPAIQRHVLENPNWYTPYTPYQAEISQGRLESLLNYQTMVTELTRMDISNASLLDQATAAFEAVFLSFQHFNRSKKKFFVSSSCFPSVVEMIKTRAVPLDIEVVVGDAAKVDLNDANLCGIMVQTPDVNGVVSDFTTLFAEAGSKGVLRCCGTDLLACTLMKAPGEMGADICFGSAQRFGIPLGYGGPHAAFFAVRDEYKRGMPGRLIGVSKDSNGKKAIRMALQTREQHIKRERATSNICTAQALLANMNAFYAVYHGPIGLKEIAMEVHGKARTLACALNSAGHTIHSWDFFDSVTVTMQNGLTGAKFADRCIEKGINVYLDAPSDKVTICLDEATTDLHLSRLLEAAGWEKPSLPNLHKLASSMPFDDTLTRTSPFMQQDVFNQFQSEHELIRYIQRLVRKDYGMCHGMVPLGSCTMKLNAAATMLPMSWSEVNNIHPLVPEDQARGYGYMCTELHQKLKDVTGFAAVSLQPNSGAQGEYAGL